MDEAIKIIGQEGTLQKILSFILISSSYLLSVICAAYSYLTKIPNFECCEKHDNSPFLKCTYKKGEICLKSFPYNYRKDYSTSVYNWAYSFDLYCDKEYYNALIGSSYFFGCIIGSIILTPLPDKFGRKNILNYTIIINCLIMYSILICKNPSLLVLLCFINGFISAIYGLFGVIISEYLSSNYRTYIMTLANAVYPMSGLILAFFFMTINNWKVFFIIVALLHTYVTYLCLKYFVESPRWLLSKNKYDQCKETLTKISKINNTEKNWEDYLKNNHNNIFNLKNATNSFRRKSITKKTDRSFFHIITNHNENIIIFNLIILWFGISLCFYGIILTLNKMKGNFFTLSILAFLGEMISELLSGFISNIYGRIFVIKYGGLIGTIFFILFQLFPEYIKPFLIFISMFGFSASFNIIYIYTPEILPISIRASICQILFLISRFAPLLIPTLSHIIGDKVDFLFIIFGFGYTISCYFLKETLNMKLVDDSQQLNDTISDKIVEDSFSFSNEEFSVFSESNYNNEYSFDMSYSRLK